MSEQANIERAAVLADLLDGRINKARANEKLRALGHEPFTPSELGLVAPSPPLDPPLDASQYDPMGEVYWTLAMTIAWIEWRSSESVRELMPRWRADRCEWRFQSSNLNAFQLRHPTIRAFLLTPFQTLQLFNEEGRPTRELEQARRDLWGKLEAGSIIARTILKGELVTIVAHEWPFLRCANDSYTGRDTLCTPDGVRYRSDVLILRTSVLQQWPDEIPTAADERRAEAALREACTAALDGAPWPKSAEWRAGAVAEFGISGRGASRVWARVAEIFPALSSPAGKPKNQRSPATQKAKRGAK
jgi:hypothetical protein